MQYQLLSIGIMLIFAINTYEYKQDEAQSSYMYGRCHDVVLSQCFDDNAEQIRLLGLLCERLEEGSRAHILHYNVIITYITTNQSQLRGMLDARCSDNLSLWMRCSPDIESPKNLSPITAHTCFYVIFIFLSSSTHNSAQLSSRYRPSIGPLDSLLTSRKFPSLINLSA